MIDTLYQAGTDAAIADRMKRPLPALPPTIPTWQNFAGGFGGFVAGPNQAAAAFSDILHADSEVLASTGTASAGGMFATPSESETKQNNAAHDKLMAQGLDMNSAAGAQLRSTAKDFMPDPQSTGKAGQILGSLTNFASQAIPAAAGGPAGLVALATARGIQKSEDLKEQGVDFNTRTAAGAVSGVLDAGSMLLPMTGATRLAAAGKGAAGGAGISVAQTEAEKLILQAGGQEKLASSYDPFDPVAIALAAIVPAAFGGLHAPSVAKAPGEARAEPTHADVTLSPAEQAHSDAVEASTMDTDIASLHAEIAKQQDAGAKAVLQTELERLQQQKASGKVTAAPLDPNVEAAARVTQAAEAIDRSRLTPDDDIAGMTAHVQAVETAADQIAQGIPVEVGDGLKFDDGAHLFDLSPLDERGYPKDYVPTRGGDERFHGTSRAIDSLSDDYAMSGENRNIYGQGFYTTDAIDVAAGYMKKGKGRDPNLYSVKAKDVPLVDMESAMTPEMKGMLRNSMGDAFPEENHVTGKPITTLREAFDEFRAESRDNGLTRDDVQEVLDSIRYNLEQEGYRGYRHVGGELTGATPHDVRIYWNPESDVSIASARIADFAKAVEELHALRNPPESAGTPNHAAFHEPGDTGAGKDDAGRTPTEPPVPETSRAAAGESVEPSRLEAAVQQILKTDPDMLVQLDGMDKPVRVAELLDAVREEGKAEIKDASLLKTATECFISF